MTTNAQNPTATRPIQGSWEDLLTQAQRLAADHNDDAIPLYEKLVTRLPKFSETQRQAINRTQS